MNYFDSADRTQSVLPRRPRREFIGTVRYRLFVDHECEWNGVVRDITASLEHEETVNTGLVLVHLAEYYRIKAHWARFKESLSESRAGD